MNEKTKYSEILDALNSEAIIIDRTGRIISASADFRRNYPAECVTIFEVNAKFGQKEFKEAVDTAFRDKKKITHRISDGYFEITADEYEILISPLSENKDLCLITVGDISDIARRRREFNLIFENSQAQIAVVDKELNIIRSNKRFRMIFGDNYNKLLPEIYQKRKSEVPNMPVSRCFKEGRPQMETQTCTAANGSKIKMLSTALPFSAENGNISSVIEISNDITEINVMQEQLNSLSDNFMSILNLCDDGILVFSGKEKISIINKAAKALFGLEGKRKPGAGYIKPMLPEHIFKSDRIIGEQIEIEAEPGNPVKLSLASKRLPDNEGLALILHKLDNYFEESGTIAKSGTIKHTELNIIIEELIRRMTAKRKEQYSLFLQQIDESNSAEDARQKYKQTHNEEYSYHIIIERFLGIIKNLTKKRTNIKVQTLLRRLNPEIEIIKETFDIDFRIVPEYTPTISINSSIFLDCTVILLYAAAGDVFKNSGIKGTIKVRFSCDAAANPYLMIEDNYIDARKEITNDELLRAGIFSAKPIFEFIKCRLETSSTPHMGRKVTVYLP